MILSLISFIFIFLTFYNSFTFFKKEPGLIKKAYTENLLDYLKALPMVIGILSLVILLLQFNLPKFLTFSWLQFFGSEGKNLIVSQTSSNNVLSPYISIVFYLLLCLCLPYLAKIEELVFRRGYITEKERIIQSIKFGFAHMLVGVPVFIALILCLLGWIFSVRYVNSLIKYTGQMPFDRAEDMAISESTSLHTKYNFLVITLAYSIQIISFFL